MRIFFFFNHNTSSTYPTPPTIEIFQEFVQLTEITSFELRTDELNSVLQILQARQESYDYYETDLL